MNTVIAREILTNIFQYLDNIKQLYSCAQVCHAWYEPAVRALYLLDAKQERLAMRHALDNDAFATVECIQQTPGYISQLEGLQLAIIHGRTKLMNAMLATPTLIKTWQAHRSAGRILLVEASLRNNLETVRRLLDVESSFETVLDYADWNPLVAACASDKDVQDARHLYEIPTKKVHDIQVQQLVSRSLPRQICPQIVLALLQAGYTVDNQTGMNLHPFHLAVAAEDEFIANLLIEHGADVHFKAKGGYTPLAIAILVGSTKMIRFLIERGADWHFLTDKGSNALHLAKTVEVAKLALQAGVAMEAIRHARLYQGRPAVEVTPLMRACECGVTEVAMFLIEQGANLHIQNQGGFTLVHSAASNGMVDVLKAVVARGLDINALDWNWRWSALHRASSVGDVNMAETLLSLGADVHVQNKKRVRPICLAETEPMMRLLMAHGSDIDYRSDDYKMTRLHRLAYCKPFDDNKKHVMELLLKVGADIDALSNDGSTPVKLGATSGQYDALQLLLAAGADPNKPDTDGWTPLMHVCRYGRDRVDRARLLLEAGANPNASTTTWWRPAGRNKITALSIVDELPDHGCYKSELRKLLLEAGAKPLPESTAGT